MPGRAVHPSAYASFAAHKDDEPHWFQSARDRLLSFLAHPLLSIWTLISIVHFVLIIGWGAAFFFLLMNWHELCEPVDGKCPARDIA